MSNHYTKTSRHLLQFLIAITVTIFGLTSCGGGGSTGGGGSVPPPSTCTTTGSGSAIAISNLPTRTSGVAPLSVFFDASGTTSTTTTRPFHDLEYRWDFGDPLGSPVSGTKWTNSSNNNGSRNAAAGPLAAHVFERPGTYTVTLTVTDCGNNTSTSSTQITVLDPDAVFTGSNTVCVAASSTPVAGSGGCPAGATGVLQPNFATAVNTYAGTGKRVLFKRGDTFTSTTGAVINDNGPGIIGAYGTGAKPIIRGNGSAAIIQPASSTTGRWRIMDLELDGQSIQANNNVGIDATGPFNQLLVLRVDIHNTRRGVVASHFVLSGSQIYNEWAVVDSTMTGIPGCNPGSPETCDWRIYMAGKQHSIQGNFLDNEDTGGSHVIRSEYMSKGVIANNTIARAGSTQHAIKLHGWKWSGGGGGSAQASTYTDKIIIADNKIVGGINDWTVSLGPQNESSDERVKDIIFERNWITSGSGTQIGVESSAAETTFRNNIIVLTGAEFHTGILISRRGIEPEPTNVHVYNNTFYSGSAGDFQGVRIGTATNTAVINNLGYAPSSTSPTMITGSGTGLTQSNNSTNAQIKSTFPGWVSASPSNPVDFRLAPGSYALGAGIAVPVFSDFFLQARPTNDLGAVEQ